MGMGKAGNATKTLKHPPMSTGHADGDSPCTRDELMQLFKFFNTFGMGMRRDITVGGRLIQNFILDTERLSLLGAFNRDKTVKNAINLYQEHVLKKALKRKGRHLRPPLLLRTSCSWWTTRAASLCSYCTTCLPSSRWQEITSRQRRATGRCWCRHRAAAALARPSTLHSLTVVRLQQTYLWV